jgi:uncharacterized membrane protein
MTHSPKEDNHTKISTNRLEAFSDGVIAIIITITVLELKTPVGEHIGALFPLIPLFIAYIISFQTIGTYWNNHHHLIQATKHISPGIMWANLHLLFWLSLIPFATGWLGENHGGSTPTALYACILLACAIAYTILQQLVIIHAENRQALEEEIKRSWKGKISLVSYLLAIPLAFVHPIISDVLIIIVSLMWFIPDRRIEKHL